MQTASAINATCTGCHGEIAAEWRASFHAQAQRDPAYQRAFAIEPLPFCQGCHAPETAANRPVPEEAADLGVGCVTCHVVGDHLLASTSGTSSPPHTITRSDEFAATAGCANCHQFAFPDRALREAPSLMQATLHEHEQSDARDVPCANCHMPIVGAGAARHRSHAFPGGHEPEFVKGALRVRAERRAANRVALVLQTEHLGHAFPTGDLFRRLEVSAEAIGNDYQAVGSARRYLSRHWAEKPQLVRVVRQVKRDDRATHTPLEIELELQLAPSERALVSSLPLAWRVAYQRVEHPRSEADEDSVLDGEIEIASGTLPPLSKGEPDHVHP
ncbi:MAG TPA: multiheme c-type cytochrome [Polyangiaceae bacterium]|nr:multiheme c-type cytochrome [Polyangiaceae bacterium]